MPNGLWPSLFQAGLASARPVVPSEAPAATALWYLATDTGDISVWNPTALAWTTPNANGAPQPIASAGSTQLGATAITSSRVVVTTATASSKGVLLPVASTGLEVEIYNKGPTFGVKVYPNSHAFINAGASNAADATVLAAVKTTIYLALDKTHWVTMRGA